MNQNHKLFHVLLLLTMVVLVASAATATEDAPTAFVFRNGVTWDTAVEGLAQAEGLQGVSGFFKAEAEHFTVYALEGVLVEQVPAELCYYMKEEQLVAACYFFTRIPAFDFDAWNACFTAEYGDPTETDPAIVAALFNAVTPGALDVEEIDAMAGWVLADGTRVYMLDLEGDLMFFCFNTPALLD